MQVVDWRKALILWFQDKVEILEYHAVFVHSPSLQFQIPSVLRLKSYIKNQHKTKVRFCRDNVYLRDLFTCQYCAKEFAARDLTLDHVHPVSKGGVKSWSNVVSACRKCNQKKANKTPEQARMPLLKLPVQPKWLPEKQMKLLSEGTPKNWTLYFVDQQKSKKYKGVG